jgi:hypothetical protein
MQTQQQRAVVCDECGFGPLPAARSCPHCGASTRGLGGGAAASRLSDIAQALSAGSLGDGNGAETLGALVPALLQSIVHPDLLEDLAGAAHADASPADEATLDELPTVRIEPHVLLRVTRRQDARQAAASAAEARARRTEAERAVAEQRGEGAVGGGEGGNGAGDAEASSGGLKDDDGEPGAAESFELRGTASSFGTHLADLVSGVTGALILADPPDASSELRNAAECRGRLVLTWRGGCSFVDKVRRVQAAGAAACIVVQTGGVWPFSMSDTALAGSDVVLPSLMISPQDGDKLKQALLTDRAAAGAGGAAAGGGCAGCAGSCGGRVSGSNSGKGESVPRLETVGCGQPCSLPSVSPASVWGHAICRDHRTACAVCMEEMVASTLAVKLPCSHVFHSECLRAWLSKQHTCPTCRAKLPTSADREARERRDAPPSWADYPLPAAGISPHSAMYT